MRNLSPTQQLIDADCEVIYMNEPITDDRSIMAIIAANPLFREDAGPNGKKSVYSTYGYIYDPDSICLMKVDKKSAPTIRYIFHQFTSGIELNQISTTLTKNGIPSPSKRRSQMGYSYNKCHVAEYWDTISLHKILTKLCLHQGSCI